MRPLFVASYRVSKFPGEETVRCFSRSVPSRDEPATRCRVSLASRPLSRYRTRYRGVESRSRASVRPSADSGKCNECTLSESLHPVPARTDLPIASFSSSFSSRRGPTRRAGNLSCAVLSLFATPPRPPLPPRDILSSHHFRFTGALLRRALCD